MGGEAAVIGLQPEFYEAFWTELGEDKACKSYWAKSDTLAVGNWSAGLPHLPVGLSWRRGGLKYLGGLSGR